MGFEIGDTYIYIYIYMGFHGNGSPLWSFDSFLYGSALKKRYHGFANFWGSQYEARRVWVASA